MANDNTTKKIILRDVNVIWAALHQAADVFGTPIYQCTLTTSDPSVADDWRSQHLKVKEKLDREGLTEYHSTIQRKKFKANGEESDPPRVVDVHKQPFTRKIPNNSTCNIIIFQYPWSFNGKSGIGNMIDSVQVVKLAEWHDTVDFDTIGGDDLSF